MLGIQIDRIRLPFITMKIMTFHCRFYFYCAGMYYLNNLSSIPNLVLYDPLPLYHSAGGIVGIGLMLVFGSTVVIRKKFSVRNFWKDCCKYNCNVSPFFVCNNGIIILCSSALVHFFPNSKHVGTLRIQIMV